ncbi:MAG: type VII secretion protein EssC, partial [Defluviitaleaceae bacterium]|nr:type VII secretion protein EssC [Defluviitaleaceae bacterium]
IAALSSTNPSPADCAAIAARLDRRLWERSAYDADFLEVRVGSGGAPSNVSVKIPQTQLLLEDDPLILEAKKLRERHGVLSGVPVTVPFADARIAGLAGSRDAIQKTVWTIITGVAAHHSYEDVKIAAVFPERERARWDFLRWLPHVWDENRRSRYAACTSGDAGALLRGLDDILKTRSRSADDKKAAKPPTPHFFVILADKALAESAGVALLPDSPAMGMTVVYAYGDMRLLPGECRTIIECGDKACSVYDKTGGGRVAFSPDKVSPEMMDSFARSLAPVRFKTAVKKAAMPDYVPLLAGFGVNSAEELDVLGRWSRSRPFESIAAPIGIRENGEVFAFDIHEKGMGPHGIVAGATRWGKSETLTTWLLSMALNFHPQEVSFVLIDFKGDGLSGILMDLPHVAGKISNVNDITSIERNLRSLQGELLRRQRVFMETKQENIHKYQEACRSGRVSEPMPYLIIVIDEFAELKTQFPDQMNGFISIARVGGSLGVYMVLATQSPGGGVVSGQVSANSRFRICLKTSEASESKDIIGTTDAYQITARGRAYIKVGNNEVYEQVQTFYSKAPYNPGSGAKGPSTKINVVELDGSRVRPEVYDKTVGATSADYSEGRAVAQYIKDTAARAGVTGARQVWTEALPERIALAALIQGKEAYKGGVWAAKNGGLSVVAGLVDDPEAQSLYPLVLDFAESGHQAVYGAPQSGKTEFLRTALLSAALLYTPDQLQLLILEFGASVLKPFETLPHTLLVASGNDSDKIRQAGQFLLDQLESRKRRFSEQGVGTLEAYREVAGEAEPALLIAVDNMASLYGMYPELLDTLAVLAREGGGFGMYLLMTANSQGSFMYRVSQYVKCSYALQLTDKADYRQLVGGNGRIEPGHFPGRGFAKGPLEFQTAICADSDKESERVRRFREQCAEMANAWRGAKPDLARAVSGEVKAGELTFTSDYVQMGVDKKSGKPFEFIFNQMNGCVITGAPGSGKTNALGWLVAALSEDAETSLYIYEKSSFLQALCGGAENAHIAHEGAEFDKFIEEINDLYNDRIKSNAGSPRLAVCIDSFTKFYEEISDETANMLNVIIQNGAGRGIYVYVADNKGALSRFANLSVKTFTLCLEKGNAIVLSGRLGEYGMLNGLYDTDAGLPGRHEGYIIHGGKAAAVRFADVKGNVKGSVSNA